MTDARPISDQSGLEVRADDFAFVYLNVDDPHVAWLAYRGVLNSPDVAGANPGNLSWFTMDVLKRGQSAALRREGILEGVRAREFPSSVSRLKCVYAYPSLESALKGDYGRGKFRRENLVAIAPRTDRFKKNIYDSNWVTDFDSLPASVAKDYWLGKQSPTPLPEYLLSGRFSVLGTGVRTRAYANIKNTWPKSLAVLELSRLAAHFDCDFGSVAPWLAYQDNKIVVRQIIRCEEKEGLEILRQAIDEFKRNPNFPINWPDLEPLRRPATDEWANDMFRLPNSDSYDHELRIDKLEEMKKFVEYLKINSP